MPENGTIDAIFNLRRLQEDYRAKGKKFYMCFVDIEKSIHKVTKKLLEWAIRKKRIPEILARSLISLYKGAKTRVRKDSEIAQSINLLTSTTMSNISFT